MRNYFIIIIIQFLFLSTGIAQSPSNNSGIVFKKMFLDYQSQNGGNISSFKDYRHGFEIGYHQKLSEKVALFLPLRYGVVDTHIDSLVCIKKKIASLDAQFQYRLVSQDGKVIPYVLAGAGGVYEDKGDFNIQFPVGFGLYFKIAPNAYINWQSEFRYSLSERRNNLQHGLGFLYMFGAAPKDETKETVTPLDSDMDGIIDELDLCPNAFGSKEFNGCPDSDGDGIADYLDKCPEFKGLKEFEGCPDSDGDGIPDNEDQCPNIAGIASNKGCPKVEDKIIDSDGDGIADDKDKCPNEKGKESAGGCPDADNDSVADKDDKCPTIPGLKIYNGCPDTDGDGIDDSRDKCPKIAGTVANDGCPEIAKEDKKTLDVAMQAVQFQTGSAILKAESNDVLNQIANIMVRYPDFNMNISGHTDNTGSALINQSLSEKRAKACYDYLIRKGVSASRLSFSGFGESRPISSNETDRGRTLNRRVEFGLVPRQ